MIVVADKKGDGREVGTFLVQSSGSRRRVRTRAEGRGCRSEKSSPRL